MKDLEMGNMREYKLEVMRVIVKVQHLEVDWVDMKD